MTLQVAIDTSSAKQHAAALKIQTSMRNRLESKAAKKAGQVTSPQQTTGGIVVIPYTAEDEGADATVERDGITRSMPSVSKPTSQMQVGPFAYRTPLLTYSSRMPNITHYLSSELALRDRFDGGR